MKAQTFVGLVFSLLATLILPTGLAPAAPDADKDVAFYWLDANADAVRRISLNIWNTPELALIEPGADGLSGE